MNIRKPSRPAATTITRRPSPRNSSTLLTIRKLPRSRRKTRRVISERTMNSVDEIIEAVNRLSEDQKAISLERLAEIDFDDEWDRQIEEDVKTGRLDKLFAQAEADIAAGRTKPLEEFLRET